MTDEEVRGRWRCPIPTMAQPLTPDNSIQDAPGVAGEGVAANAPA